MGALRFTFYVPPTSTTDSHLHNERCGVVRCGALANRVNRLKRTTCMLSNSSSCSRRLDGRVYLDATDPYLESNTM